MTKRRKGSARNFNSAHRIWHNPSPFLVRSEPASAEALQERIPELYPLREKTIAVAGLGCVGAPSALEFARCGIGRLRLLDHDHVSPGASCRWPLGMAYSGLYKTQALENFIQTNYPLTRVLTDHFPPNSYGFQIGRPHAYFNEWEYIDKFLEGADLVFDATAEMGVNQFLADRCCEKKIPFIFVSSRQGGWGGEVGRIRPGKTPGCFTCFLYSQDERIDLKPPAKKDDFVQPIGCSDPTFTAASFDTTEVSLAGVRLAVSTLCEGQPHSYPPIEGDLMILSLRDPAGEKVLSPSWTTHTIERHPACCGGP